MKHSFISLFANKSTTVKVVYPLKQGLKRNAISSNGMYSSSVKVVYPLKQGLKPLVIPNGFVITPG